MLQLYYYIYNFLVGLVVLTIRYKVYSLSIVVLFVDQHRCYNLKTNAGTVFNRNPPSRSNIRQWVIKFSNTGSLKKSKPTGRSLKPYIQKEFKNCKLRLREVPLSTKSIRVTNHELNIPKSSVY